VVQQRHGLELLVKGWDLNPAFAALHLGGHLIVNCQLAKFDLNLKGRIFIQCYFGAGHSDFSDDPRWKDFSFSLQK
jgi:hypothetical protein